MSTPAASGTTPKAGIHPGIVVGAIAVVVFGAAGAASYLGLLPGQPSPAPASPVSVAKPAQQAGLVPDAVVPPPPVAAAPAPAPAQPPVPEPAPAPVAAIPAPAATPPAPAPVAAKPAPQPAPDPAPVAAKPGPSTPSYATAPATAAPAAPVAAAPAPAPKVCGNCGTITDIVPIEKKGDSSGAGAVIGGIVGGVLGHQVGGGRGKDVATVAGAVGGALLGNEVEKSRGSVAAWDVRVKLEDGTSTVVRFGTEPSWRVGDKVRVENGKLVRG